MEIRGLLRFFDTNTYFRQPVVTARPMRSEPLVVEEYRFAHAALNIFPRRIQMERPRIKAVLTGPYTLAKFSLSESDATAKSKYARQAYAEALAAEIARSGGGRRGTDSSWMSRPL